MPSRSWTRAWLRGVEPETLVTEMVTEWTQQAGLTGTVRIFSLESAYS